MLFMALDKGIHCDLTHCGLVAPYGDIDLGQQSTLVQAMPCCLTAPNHYLEQC